MEGVSVQTREEWVAFVNGFPEDQRFLTSEYDADDDGIRHAFDRDLYDTARQWLKDTYGDPALHGEAHFGSLGPIHVKRAVFLFTPDRSTYYVGSAQEPPHALDVL